jgi:hypothetical protein
MREGVGEQHGNHGRGAADHDRVGADTVRHLPASHMSRRAG